MARRRVLLSALIIATPAIASPAAAPDDSQPASPISDSVEVVRDVVYATVPATGDHDEPMTLTFDAAMPKETDGEPLPAVVYLHGGGWRFGDKADGMPMTVAMAAGGYLALTVEYRRTGTAPYPAAVHDGKAVIRFLRANAADLGIDPDRIGVWGHSAGGHLSALLGTSAGVPELDGTLGPADADTSVRCVVCVSGPSDLTRPINPRGQAMIHAWLGAGEPAELERRARMASPVTHVDAGDAPFLVVHGTDDSLVPLEQGLLLHETLKSAGVPSRLLTIRGAGHVILDPEAYEAVAAFFDEHLGGSAQPSMIESLRRYFSGG